MGVPEVLASDGLLHGKSENKMDTSISVFQETPYIVKQMGSNDQVGLLWFGWFPKPPNRYVYVWVLLTHICVLKPVVRKTGKEAYFLHQIAKGNADRVRDAGYAAQWSGNEHSVDTLVKFFPDEAGQNESISIASKFFPGEAKTPQERPWEGRSYNQYLQDEAFACFCCVTALRAVLWELVQRSLWKQVWMV